MKVKLFSFFILAFLTISSISAVSVTSNMNYISEIQTDDCLDRVDIIVAQADAAGWSSSELAWLSNGALAVYCYGYTWEDVISAP